MTFFTFLHNTSITLAILFAALGLGSVINIYIINSQINDFLTDIWVSGIIGLGFLSLATLFLGMLGFHKVHIFITIILIFAAFGIYRVVKNIKILILIKLIEQKKINFPIIIIIFIIFSTVFWIFLTHALMPPHEWDEIAYHLALAKIYVQGTQIGYIPTIVTSNWPLNSTMLFSIALMFETDIAPHLMMLAMTILILFGLVFFGYKFADIYLGLLASTLFITIPLTKRLAGTGLIDVPMGLYGIAALVCFEYWRKYKKNSWVILCGLCTGFIAGTKLTGAAFILIFGIMILCHYLISANKNKRTLFKICISFSLSALVVVIPWYAKSYFFTGNPIYPFGYSIFNGLNWDSLGDDYHSFMQMSLFSPNLPRNIVGLVKTLVLMLIQPHILGGYIGGLGVILPICFFISVFFLFSGPSWIKTNTIVGLLYFIAWFLFASLQLRYLLPITPLMAWNSAYIIKHFYRINSKKRIRLFIIFVLSFVILIDWPWIKINEVGLFLKRLPYITGQITREQWLESQLDIYPLIKYSNHNLPEDSNILLLPFENRGYYLDIPYFWGHPYSQRVIKFEEYQDPGLLVKELSKLGISHIIDNPNWINTDYQFWDHDRKLMLALEKHCGEELFNKNNITLYKLVKCSSDNAP